eukprot:scaffold150193_cov30-Tisochrysis_lutea.AAC.1
MNGDVLPLSLGKIPFHRSSLSVLDISCEFASANQERFPLLFDCVDNMCVRRKSIPLVATPSSLSRKERENTSVVLLATKNNCASGHLSSKQD